MVFGLWSHFMDSHPKTHIKTDMLTMVRSIFFIRGFITEWSEKISRNAQYILVIIEGETDSKQMLLLAKIIASHHQICQSKFIGRIQIF